MRSFIFATASVALSLEDAYHADFQEHLSLLQLSARPHSVAENSDDLDDLGETIGVSYPITWDSHRSFGPDGTWATPYCKNIQGCTKVERVCPAGCNGIAYWEPFSFGSAKLGVPNLESQRQAHYLGCLKGQVARGAPVGGFGPRDAYGRWQNCLNGPDSDKPALASADAAWIANTKIENPIRADYTQSFYQNEYCPADCVNDCAMFKMGHFVACGYTPPFGFRTRGPATGPNEICDIGKVVLPASRGAGTVSTTSFTWCGEPTTTTTTPVPPPVEEPVEEPVGEPVGDEAGAVGDPHITSNTGRHFDLE